MKIAPHSYAVTGLGAIPPWVVNAGFVIGQEKTLIIDTGMNLLGAQTIYGYASTVRPQNQLMAINLEPHFDHIGGNGFLKSQGVSLYGHPEIQRTSEQFQAEKEEYNQSILNYARRSARETEAFFQGTCVVNPDYAIGHGDRLDLGHVQVEVIATPGHTPINLSIYNETDQVLFCGDSLVHGYIPNLEAGSIADWQKWLQSLDLIENLAPQVILPGHGNVLRGGEIQPEINRVRSIVQAAIKQGQAPTG